jgi:hypothetical protein
LAAPWIYSGHDLGKERVEMMPQLALKMDRANTQRQVQECGL